MPRCSVGSRKCFSGQCVKKSSAYRQRCAKGTRKCANKKCYKTGRNYHMGSKRRRTAKK
jgi:hypothetical protein